MKIGLIVLTLKLEAVIMVDFYYFSCLIIIFDALFKRDEKNKKDNKTYEN